MNQNAAEIEIVAAAHERERYAAIDGKRGNRSPDHPAFDYLDRRVEAFDRFIAQPKGEKDQHKRVGEGGESAGAMVAVGFFGVRRTFRPAHGQPGNAESGNIGKIVHSIVEQSYGAPE